jgi:2-dehydro-3-deoxy-L-rhamnonate dehydrogenase (NAD+)
VSRNLRGQVAIVTGGAGGQSGLGLTAAEGLLRAGARVAVWDNDPAAIERADAELRGLGLEVRFQQVDVTNRDQVRAAYDAVRAELGPVDTLLNNAALKMEYVLGPKSARANDGIVPFWEVDLDRFRKLWEVDVIGPLLTSSCAAPDMVARGKGSIINVVTSQHTERSPRHIPYGPSKAMLETMTQAMAAQFRALAPEASVRANAILPGGSANRRGEHDPSRPRYDCMVPVILWLASDESRAVSGEIFAGSQFQVPV